MFHRSRRARLLSLALMLLIASALATVGTFVSQAPQARAADSPDGSMALLLIHGYSDSCASAFQSTNDPANTDLNGNSTPGSNATTTLSYLTNHGWGSPIEINKISVSNIDEIGYYGYNDKADGTSNSDTGCDNSLIDSTVNQQGLTSCNSLLPTDNPNDSHSIPTGDVTKEGYRLGTLNDPIQHLGCLLAWYIYDKYTFYHIPVEVLAHSMGGLIIRDALAESQGGTSGFPQHLLDVRRVVTVGTPHGGILPLYASIALDSSSTEVANMTTGSSFLTNLAQRPEGLNDTFWALVGASNGAAPLIPIDSTNPGLGSTCLLTGYSTASTESCLILLTGQGGRYPDTDGVVPSISTMEMQADYKVLYGVVNDTAASQPFVADNATQYEHEDNTCGKPSFPVVLDGQSQTITIGGCSSAPFYLNDGAPDSTLTKAWVCTSSCNATTDYSDLHIGNGSAVPTWHSLAEIAWLLAPSTHGNIGQVTSHSPSMAYFNGRIYICWVGSDSHLNVGYLTNETYNPNTGAPAVSNVFTLADTSSDGCSLASYGNTARLYLAFTGTNNQIYVVSTLNGTDWTSHPHVTVPNTSHAAVQIVSLTNGLYLTFTGTNNVVYVEAYDGNTTFSHQTPVGLSDTGIGPGICSFSGSIEIAYRGEGTSNQIYLTAPTISTSGSITAGPDQALPGVLSPDAPALTSVNNLLHIGWTGEDGHLYLAATDTFPATNFLSEDHFSDTSNNGPALGVANYQIIWAWSGTDNPSHLYVAAQF